MLSLRMLILGFIFEKESLSREQDYVEIIKFIVMLFSEIDDFLWKFMEPYLLPQKPLIHLLITSRAWSIDD